MSTEDYIFYYLDRIEDYSGILIVFALLLISLSISNGCRIIARELKFIFRRTEILDVNDSLRHVPRDLKTDYFHQNQGQ